MTTTLITGANKGLGYETARRLLVDGHEVWMGARDPERGRMASEELGGHFVGMDVTDEQSVAAAARQIEERGGGLDVLINNAGITGRHAAPPETVAEDMRHVFETNVFAIVTVTRAFCRCWSVQRIP